MDIFKKFASFFQIQFLSSTITVGFSPSSMSFDFLDDTIRNIIPTSNVTELTAPPKTEKVKRPLNAFNIFFMEQQSTMKIEHPLLSGNQISQELGRKWKDMSDEEKKPYLDRARDLHTKFRQENPDYHYHKKNEIKKKVKSKESPIISNFNENDAHFRDVFNNLLTSIITQFLFQSKPLLDAIDHSIDDDLLPKLLQTNPKQ